MPASGPPLVRANGSAQRTERIRPPSQHISYTKALARFIRARGPVPTVRVSSARARGRAKAYAYWGAVRYEITLDAGGHPQNRALCRATSDRRSRRLALEDAAYLASAERRVMLQAIGRLSEEESAYILEQLGGVLPDAE